MPAHADANRVTMNANKVVTATLPKAVHARRSADRAWPMRRVAVGRTDGHVHRHGERRHDADHLHLDVGRWDTGRRGRDAQPCLPLTVTAQSYTVTLSVSNACSGRWRRCR